MSHVSQSSRALKKSRAFTREQKKKKNYMLTLLPFYNGQGLTTN